ncbi:hypothetical protein [Amycolatopsis sp. NPDC003731]
MRMTVHANLGHAGDHRAAGTHLTEALRLAEQSGDLAAQARTHVILAQAYGQQDALAAALEHATTALRLDGRGEPAPEHRAASLRLIRRLDHPTLEPDVLDSLGFIADHTGEHQAAVGYYRQAVTAYLACGGEYFERGAGHLVAGAGDVPAAAPRGGGGAAAVDRSARNPWTTRCPAGTTER